METQPTQKIAMVTPLPPERTGIADYVAVLLPSLARHFQVDLYTTADLDEVGSLRHDFVIRPWQELESHRDEYDQVVYQFGNSPFHSHMVELLDRVPGIVVLHDFFLSSKLAYMDQHQGHAGLFKAELERSHGAQALSVLLLKGPGEASKLYPASRRIIERATAVLVHSEHSGELRNNFYPSLPPVAWHKVPMPQVPAPPISREARQQIRDRLGVAASDFLVISLGFLADTKLNHVLLAALADDRLGGDPDMRIIFVGENDQGEYGEGIKQQINDLACGNRITITGFVDVATYQDYLAAADCAVQMRTRSRGETSKAVHDCMSHALPIIVNDYAAFSELPGNAVRKIGAEADPGELADALWLLRSDPLKRAVLGMSAKHYMTANHLAYTVAAKYAAAIRESIGATAASGTAG